MRYLLILLIFISCGTSQVVSSEDITHKAKWLESNPDNPIINIIQKTYENDNVEIIIKKKLTTDYVKLMLTRDKKRILKTTVRN
jgi:hypothetical protein|tara:strand:- start:164 stop:415 length:252 start_codon:yes stop_codon:yes gene_type:complete